MNILNKIVPFKMRRGLAALGVAGAMAGACKKVEPTQDTKPVEIELYFSSGGAGGPGYGAVKPDSLSKTLQKYANDNVIIYLVPVTRWGHYDEIDIPLLRQKFLEPALNMSPKFRGRGDFDFELGAASKVPEDSLWYVKNGWTINKNGNQR